MALGTVNTNQIASEAVTVPKVADQVLTHRNFITNGAMNVAARGSSQTTAGYGSIDRYYLSLSGATATMSQEAFSTSDRNSLGFEKYLKLAVSTANNNSGIYYRIEANDVVHLIGSKATFSFYAKGTNPAGGSFQTKPQWYNNSSGGGDNGVAQSLTVTSTWTRYSFTFDIPAPSNTVIDTNAYLGFEILQPAGDTSTTAWELNTTGWQVEAGDTKTDFEHEDIGTTLSKCQRFFISCKGFGSGYTAVAMFRSVYANQAFGAVGFPTEMRATPAVTLFDGSGNTGTLTEDGAAHNRGCAANNVSTRGFNKAISNGTGSGNFSSAAGAGYAIVGTYQADAEL
jgi:hypothetical protein